jgi:hypothetical protein
MVRFYFIVILIITSLTGNAQTEKKIYWKSDLEYLKRELPLKHKDLFFQMSKNDYEKRLDYLSSHLSGLSDFEIAIKIQELIAKIGDSHTSAACAKFMYPELTLPLQLYWFSDGIYVMQTTKDYEKLLGSRIVRINGFDILSIADSLSTLITVDNQALIKSNIPKMIPSLQLLGYFGFSKGNGIKIEAESEQGQPIDCEIRAGKFNRNDIINFKPDSVAFCWQNQRQLFIDKYFEKEGIYYIQYNKCLSKEIDKYKGIM